MNKVKIMTNILYRMFSTKRGKVLAGVHKRMKLMEQDEQFDVEELDPQDISEYEADFMVVGESHKMHVREMAGKKEYVKRKIVAKRYFSEKEPRFLTFAEKKLIHTLHESNPEEWPVERLSESFPALPETIKKILHAKWSPKSIKSVIRYDNVVVENWRKFCAGKLPVNPILNQHLMKFKNRKIILTDRELMAKQFIPPKPEFKKPKSQLFTNIIQAYLDGTQDKTKLLSQENNSNKTSYISNHCDENQNLLIANTTACNSLETVNKSERFALKEEVNNTSRSYTDSEERNIVYNQKKNQQQKEEPLTFNEFVKVKLKDISKLPPEEGITLLDIYKKQVDANQEMQTAEVATASDNSIIGTKEDSTISENKDCDSDIVAADDNLVDTHIKLWKKKVDTEYNYINPIKIAKNVYKPGMSYRIGDCYYDDDGEFLYRVPGVQS